MNRTTLFTLLRPWLDDSGFTPARIQALDAWCDAAGVPTAAEAPAGGLSSIPAAIAPQAASTGGKSTYDRAAMIAELRRDEGERLKQYKDTVGKWTIGVGRNLDDVGCDPLTRALSDIRANGITAAESAQLLGHDLDRVDADLDRKLPWWRELDPVRQRVLVNMCFNMGIGGLLGFVNTLGMIQHHRFTEAAQNMLQSKWARQVGDRAVRLSNMMRTGQ